MRFSLKDKTFDEMLSFLREILQIDTVKSAASEGKPFGEGNALLTLNNKFSAGETVEAVGPDLRPFAFEVPMMEDMDGLPLREPRKPRMEFRMRLPKAVPPMTILRIARDLSAK